MIKKRLVLFVVLSMFIVLFINLASASFQLGNLSYKIVKIYGPNDNIKDWLNISFQNEATNTKISAVSGFNGEIKVKDFLDANFVDYICIPDDCEDEYKATGIGQNAKSFSLAAGEEKVLGIKLTGEIDENEGIGSLSFDVSADNQLSCMNPLEIDILNDDVIEWEASSLTNTFQCETGRGCFENVEEEVRLGKNTFCEKINLLKNKKFQLGTWIKGNDSTTWANGILKMELYDLDGVLLSSCNLQKPSLTGNDIGCAVELDEEISGENYVCLKSNQTTYYKIRRESEEPCGFYGSVPPTNFSYDYSIFAKGAKFGNIGSFTFNQQKYEEQGSGNLAEYVDSYIDKYDRDCTNDCVIPIKFKANTAISVEVSNPLLTYYTTGGVPVDERKVYETEMEPAKLTSDFNILDLSKSNITVPSQYGNHTLKLYIGTEKILEEKIEVVKAPVIKGVYPTIVSAGMPTKFSVVAESPAGRNISVYRWDFGDGSSENTTTNSITHAYPSIDGYLLTIEVEDNAGFKASKSFSVIAGSPEEAVNSTISRYKVRLDNLTTQLSLMPSWIKDETEKIVNAESLIEELGVLERKYSSAASDEEYVDIMEQLTELKIPYMIKTTRQGSTPFFVNIENIKPGYLSEFEAGSYKEEAEEEYKEAITAWAEENLDVILKFEYVSAYYDNKIEVLLSVFNLETKTNEERDRELYVMVGDNAVFKDKELRTKEFDDAVGVKFSDIKDRNIEFVVLGEVFPEDLAVYLSPEFSLLTVEIIEPCNFNGRCEKDLEENWKNCRSDCKPYGIVAIILLAIIFIALIAYIFMQLWYKKKYENYLFRNKNDLYNLTTFITNAKNQGLSDNEIKAKLKQAGWSSEQINYISKKMTGKAIMPFDFMKLFKRFERAKLKTSQPPGRLLPS